MTMNRTTKLQHARQAEAGHNTSLGSLLSELSAPTAPVPLPAYAVAALPAAADYAGHLVYCTNGAVGSPIVAFSDGTDWLRVDTGAAVAAA